VLTYSKPKHVRKILGRLAPSRGRKQSAAAPITKTRHQTKPTGINTKRETAVIKGFSPRQDRILA